MKHENKENLKQRRRSTPKNVDIDINEVYECGKKGYTIDLMCDKLGISRTIWYEHTKDGGKWVDHKAKYYAGNAFTYDKISNKCIELALSGNDKMIKLYLETRGKWDKTEKVQLTGVDDGPIQISDVAERLFDKLTKQ
jgi:hypothetical protein